MLRVIGLIVVVIIVLSILKIIQYFLLANENSIPVEANTRFDDSLSTMGIDICSILQGGLNERRYS